MGKLIGRFVGGGLFVLVAAGAGFAAFFYSKAHVTPKFVSVPAQMQFELDEAVQMKNEVTLMPRGDDPDGVVDVRVAYGVNPPEAQKALFIHDTNMVVRRHIAHLGDLQILWAGEKVPEPGATDAGRLAGTAPIAPPQVPGAGALGTADAGVAATGGHGKPSVTVLPDKPQRKAGNGFLTLVTFPEAYVSEGSKTLGKTPLFKVKLPAGTHLLTLVGTDGAKHQLSVPVAAGGTRAMKVKLADVPQ